MKKTARILAVLMAALVFAGTIPQCAFATDEYDWYTVTYTDGDDYEEVFDEVSYLFSVAKGKELKASDIPEYEYGTPVREYYVIDKTTPWLEKGPDEEGKIIRTANWKKVFGLKYTDGIEDEEFFEDEEYSYFVGGMSTVDMPEFTGTISARRGYVIDRENPWLEEGPDEMGWITRTPNWKEVYTVTYTDGVEDAEIFQDQNYVILTTEDVPSFQGDEPQREGYTIDKETPWVVDGPDGSGYITITPNWVEEEKKSDNTGDNTSGRVSPSKETTTVSEIEETEVPLAETPSILNDKHVAYVSGYNDGTIRPENKISRAEVAAMLYNLLKPEVIEANKGAECSFSDIKGSEWYAKQVATMNALEIMGGYPDGSFKPEEPITRAELAVIASKFIDVSGEESVEFTDITGYWAETIIKQVAAQKLVSGYPDGSFKPQQPVTRAETMAVVNNILNRRPETVEDLTANKAVWSDNNNVNAWYYLVVEEATTNHDYKYKENGYETWVEATAE